MDVVASTAPSTANVTTMAKPDITEEIQQWLAVMGRNLPRFLKSIQGSVTEEQLKEMAEGECIGMTHLGLQIVSMPNKVPQPVPSVTSIHCVTSASSTTVPNVTSTQSIAISTKAVT